MSDETNLKAERVQEELVAGAIDARLKAERVQERLKQIPGWGLAQGGQSIDRVRELGTPDGAADYAGFVLREAARAGQRVGIGLLGNRVVLNILAASHGGVHGGITNDQLDLAATLG